MSEEHKNTNAPVDEDQAHRDKMKALQQEQREKVRATTIQRGILIVNTGDGKGKSTAAFGTIIRAVGHGQRVGLVQFIKGKWKTGEREFFKRLEEVDHVISGDGFTWNTQDRQQDIASAEHGWNQAKAMIEACRGDDPAYHLIVLDELNIALRYDYLDIHEVVAVLKERPEQLNVIVTGRDAKPELIEAADTVSRVEPVKHAFEAGIKAQKGVDF
ncbi:MAG: cob(I)yrinic acid a,c-diamide adenosyltransferase [Myxococcota bacterium]